MNLRDCLVRHGIINSRKVCALPVATQLFFRNLLHACDGAGRFVADADDLRLALYQHALDRVTRLHVSRWMADCHRAELVRLYTGPDGRGYGEVLKYGQRDRNRRIIHPAREADQMNFAAPPAPDSLDPEKHPPPDEFPRESEDEKSPERNRREKNPPAPAASGDVGKEEVLYFSQRLFNTMAELEGSPIDKLTKAGRRTITGALSAIRLVKPDLHPADLEKAAAAWKKLFPTASLTARAMATHWAKLQGSPVARSADSLVEPEPLGWRDWINENTPDAKYARGGELEGTPWHDLDAAYRRYLITQCQRRDERGHAA